MTAVASVRAMVTAMDMAMDTVTAMATAVIRRKEFLEEALPPQEKEEIRQQPLLPSGFFCQANL